MSALKCSQQQLDDEQTSDELTYCLSTQVQLGQSINRHHSLVQVAIAVVGR